MAKATVQTDLEFEALDGYSLAASLFAPETPKAALVIGPATAVKRGIYAKFADYLAARGAAVLTFDYRGIGGSRPADLRAFDAPMRDWGLKDLPAAIDLMRARYPGLPLLLAGHSFGAQALAITDRNAHVARALMIAAMTGYWRNFAGLEGYRVMLMTGGPGRLLGWLNGYIPGWAGIGEDLPRAVFEEWMGWCRDPDYFFGDETLPETARVRDYSGSILVINAADDPWTTRASTAALIDRFSNADATVRFVTPQEAGVRKLGHFGFFRSAQRGTLWPQAADWLLNDL